ncbi:MAG: hypothetical protein ABI200_00840, partial [Gaiellales bacterium]
MDHSRTPSTTGFADDFDEFDHLLDDDDDAQPTPAPRGGRSGSPAAPGGTAKRMPGLKPRLKRAKAAGSGVRMSPDWNRIAAVLFVAAVVLMLLYFVISGIASSRRENSYKDYFSKVRDIAAQSTSQGDELNTILVDPDSGDRSQRIARIEQLSSRADKLRKDAVAVQAPKQMTEAHEWFVTSMQYRASGLSAVQRSISSSIEAKDKEAAASGVAEAMARLVAADVIWADSFVTEARGVLKDDKVEGVTVPDSVFMTDFEKLSPKNVTKMLDRLKLSTTASSSGKAKVPKDGKIRGGQLESGQVTVAPSGQTLIVGGTTKIKGGDGVSFEVPFTNQGEVQLTAVPVKITIRGSESDPMKLTGVIDVVDPGQTATAKVAMDEVPNFGELLDVDILVGPIPGEKVLDNNSG